MRVFDFQSELWIPRPIEQVFAFFADAQNLQTLTPDWLKFCIVTPCPIAMKPGATIDYRLKVHGIPLKWRTEITAWEPPHRFVDEQRRGPYHLWIHEHRFESKDGGTRASDTVRYSPLGGWLTNRLFVRRDVEQIFHFRHRKLLELFAPQPAVL